MAMLRQHVNDAVSRNCQGDDRSDRFAGKDLLSPFLSRSSLPSATSGSINDHVGHLWRMTHNSRTGWSRPDFGFNHASERPVEAQRPPRTRAVPVVVGSGISNLRHTARSCTRLAWPWLHTGVIKYVGNIAVLMNRRPVPDASRRRVVVVVVDVVGGLSHTRGGGHHRDGLIVSELAATPTAFQNGDEAAPVLLVEEGVEDRIYARVAGAQPLSDRCGDRQDLVLSFRYVAAELDHGEDDVEGQPREDEQYHDHHQHFYHLHLRLLLYPLHLSVLGVCGYVSAPHLDPYEDVAERYEDHWQHVTEGQVADQKEQRAILRMWPCLQAEPQIRIVVVNGDQIEKQQPGRRHRQSDEPDHHDHHASAPLRDLALERPPNRQESEERKPEGRLLIAEFEPF